MRNKIQKSFYMFFALILCFSGCSSSRSSSEPELNINVPQSLSDDDYTMTLVVLNESRGLILQRQFTSSTFALGESFSLVPATYQFLIWISVDEVNLYLAIKEATLTAGSQTIFFLTEDFQSEPSIANELLASNLSSISFTPPSLDNDNDGISNLSEWLAGEDLPNTNSDELTPTEENTECVTYYSDEDGDGFGDSDNTQVSCENIPNFVTISGDCDDSDASINPDALDVCGDDIDNNCDGERDISEKIICLDSPDFSEHGKKILGTDSGDEWGAAIIPIQDQDGDGLEDLIVTAPQPFSGTGKFYLISGTQLSAGTERNISSVFSRRWEGDPNFVVGDQLGYSGCSSEDLNGDGFSDLIISAPFSSPHAGADGTVLGLNNLLTAASPLSIPGLNYNIIGEERSDLAGVSLVCNSDLSGDSSADLVIGALGAPFGQLNGHVHILRGQNSNIFSLNTGSSLLTTGRHLSDLLIHPNNLAIKISHSQSGAQFGRNMCSGDFDGNGSSDLAVSAHAMTINGTSGVGSIYFFSGEVIQAAFTLGSDLTELNATAIWQGATTSQEFGGQLLCLDANGDGKTDITTTSIESGTTSRVLILRGPFTGTQRLTHTLPSSALSITTENFSDGLGSSLSQLSSEGGDGIVIGISGLDGYAPYSEINNAGAVLVIPELSSLTGSHSWSEILDQTDSQLFLGASNNQRLGLSLAVSESGEKLFLGAQLDGNSRGSIFIWDF